MSWLATREATEVSNKIRGRVVGEVGGFGVYLQRRGVQGRVRGMPGVDRRRHGFGNGDMASWCYSAAGRGWHWLTVRPVPATRE
jgi:hypothetical protein